MLVVQKVESFLKDFILVYFPMLVEIRSGLILGCSTKRNFAVILENMFLVMASLYEP